MKKMQLSLIGLTCVALLAGSASAAAANYKGEAMAPAPVRSMMGLKDGWYVGANVGYDSFRARANFSVVQGGDSVSVSNPFSFNGWMGGLFAGYGMYSNSLYLGGELFVDDSAANDTNTISSGDATLAGSFQRKLTGLWSYGISFLPGYKLNDFTLGYLRLGYNRTGVRTQDTFTVTPVVGAASSTSSSKSNWSNGWDLGIGLETAVADCLSIRTEYKHVYLSSYNNNTAVWTDKVNPTDNQFSVGLVYHFA